MPENFYDPWWLIGTLVIIIFLPLLTFFMVRLVKSFDKVADLLTETRREAVKTETRLEDHIGNEAVHCKGMACKMLSPEKG